MNTVFLCVKNKNGVYLIFYAPSLLSLLWWHLFQSCLLLVWIAYSCESNHYLLYKQIHYLHSNQLQKENFQKDMKSYQQYHKKPHSIPNHLSVNDCLWVWFTSVSLAFSIFASSFKKRSLVSSGIFCIKRLISYAKYITKF